MAVDRPEDGGEFRHGQDRGADTALDSHTAPDSHTALGTDSAGLADPERRVIAHRMYRALVDRTYGVARDAWSQALPDLRATWAEHVAKYPEQSRAEPRTQPDGSWAADGGRKLGPDQNAEATRACADIRKEGKDVIRPAMERVEAADPSRRLTGLEHMLKGEDRLKAKIAERLRYNPEWTPKRALAEVPDAVRFTIAYSESHYTDGVRSDVERLKAEGFELIKLKNLWTKEQYKGINSQWRTPETGVRFEVQFHTPTSFEAKELTHKAYERLRNPATGKDEEVRLEDYQRRVTAQVTLPPDVFEIEDHPLERRDG